MFGCFREHSDARKFRDREDDARHTPILGEPTANNSGCVPRTGSAGDFLDSIVQSANS
jgi:hypothetical protein